MVLGNFVNSQCVDAESVGTMVRSRSNQPTLQEPDCCLEAELSGNVMIIESMKKSGSTHVCANVILSHLHGAFFRWSALHGS